METVTMMGLVVRVNAEMHRSHHDKMLVWDRHVLTRPRPGWVVGVRTVQEGRVVGGSIYGPEDVDPRYLKVTKRIKVYMVTYWPTMNPVYVLAEDMQEADAYPYPPNGSPTERKEMRSLLASRPQDYPRDKRGRFVKVVWSKQP